MAEYVPTGPFVNLAAPGISAAFLNNVENFIEQLEGDTGSVVLNGSTSGTATAYQVLQSIVKIVLVQLVNFRNGSAPAQTLALPVAFTTSLHGWNSGIGGAVPQLMKVGVAQTVQEFLSATAGASGSVSGQTTLLSNWLWHMDGGFDTISFPGSQVGVTSGQLIMIGI